MTRQPRLRCRCLPRLFATEYDAQHQLDRIAARGTGRGRPTAYYPCPNGRGYHLTAAPRESRPPQHQPRRRRAHTGPGDDIRSLALARDEYACVHCGVSLLGNPIGYSLHHRRGRGAGGTSLPEVNEPAALVCLCGSGTTGCHDWVERNRRHAQRLGLLVPRNALNNTPADYPVRTWRHGWVLLDNAGGWRPASDPRSTA